MAPSARCVAARAEALKVTLDGGHTWSAPSTNVQGELAALPSFEFATGFLRQVYGRAATLRCTEAACVLGPRAVVYRHDAPPSSAPFASDESRSHDGWPRIDDVASRLSIPSCESRPKLQREIHPTAAAVFVTVEGGEAHVETRHGEPSAQHRVVFRANVGALWKEGAWVDRAPSASMASDYRIYEITERGVVFAACSACPVSYQPANGEPVAIAVPKTPVAFGLQSVVDGQNGLLVLHFSARFALPRSALPMAEELDWVVQLDPKDGRQQGAFFAFGGGTRRSLMRRSEAVGLMVTDDVDGSAQWISITGASVKPDKAHLPHLPTTFCSSQAPRDVVYEVLTSPDGSDGQVELAPADDCIVRMRAWPLPRMDESNEREAPPARWIGSRRETAAVTNAYVEGSKVMTCPVEAR